MRDDTELARLILADAVAAHAAQQTVEERAEADAERIETERRAAEARAEQQRVRVGRERNGDSTAMAIGFWFAITVIGPLALGYFVLRHTFLLPVRSDTSSDSEDVFTMLLWCVVSAQATVAFVVGLFLLRPPWLGRQRNLLIGGVLVVLAIVGAVEARNRFVYQELMATAYPFARNFVTCGSAVKIPINETDSDPAQLWQLYRAQVKGTQGSECNRLVLYRGQASVSVHDLPSGDYYLPESVADGGAAMFAVQNQTPLSNSDVRKGALSDFTFFARTSRGSTVSVTLSDPTQWR